MNMEDLIYLIIFALYAVCGYLSFGPGNMFIVALVFTAISTVIVLVVNEYIGLDFNSAPLQVFLALYFAIQIIVSLILTAYTNSLNNSIIAQMIILVVFGIIIMTLYQGKQYIEKEEKNKQWMYLGYISISFSTSNLKQLILTIFIKTILKAFTDYKVVLNIDD